MLAQLMTMGMYALLVLTPTGWKQVDLYGHPDPCWNQARELHEHDGKKYTCSHTLDYNKYMKQGV